MAGWFQEKEPFTEDVAPGHDDDDDDDDDDPWELSRKNKKQ